MINKMAIPGVLGEAEHMVDIRSEGMTIIISSGKSVFSGLVFEIKEPLTHTVAESVEMTVVEAFLVFDKRDNALHVVVDTYTPSHPGEMGLAADLARSPEAPVSIVQVIFFCNVPAGCSSLDSAIINVPLMDPEWAPEKYPPVTWPMENVMKEM